MGRGIVFSSNHDGKAQHPYLFSWNLNPYSHYLQTSAQHVINLNVKAETTKLLKKYLVNKASSKLQISVLGGHY